MYAKLAGVASISAVAALIYYFIARTHPPYDISGYLIGRDFLNTWLSGQAALNGNAPAWFDMATYNAAIHERFGDSIRPHNWSYPPHIMLFTWPLALLPYLVALCVWTLAGYASLYAAVRRFLHSPTDYMFVFLSPAAAVNVFAGQNGLFTAALMIAGLSCMDRKPILAGIMFGLLTIKPQLGIMLPVMLLASAQWRVIIAATATTIALVGISAAVFGADTWRAYFETVLPIQSLVMRQSQGPMLAMMPTVFQNLRMAGAPELWGWIAQAIAGIASAVAVAWTYARRRDPALSCALVTTATIVASPYAFNYDLVALSVFILPLTRRPGLTWLDHAVLISGWMLPILTLALAVYALPLSSTVVIVLMFRLLHLLHRSNTVGETTLGRTLA